MSTAVNESTAQKAFDAWDSSLQTALEEQLKAVMAHLQHAVSPSTSVPQSEVCSKIAVCCIVDIFSLLAHNLQKEELAISTTMKSLSSLRPTLPDGTVVSEPDTSPYTENLDSYGSLTEKRTLSWWGVRDFEQEPRDKPLHSGGVVTIKGFPAETAKEQVVKWAEEFGTIKDVWCSSEFAELPAGATSGPRKRVGCADIKYERLLDAVKAQRGLNRKLCAQDFTLDATAFRQCGQYTQLAASLQGPNVEAAQSSLQLEMQLFDSKPAPPAARKTASKDSSSQRARSGSKDKYGSSHRSGQHGRSRDSHSRSGHKDRRRERTNSHDKRRGSSSSATGAHGAHGGKRKQRSGSDVSSGSQRQRQRQ